MKKPSEIIKSSGIRPPKPGQNYYICEKCGHHWEGFLPVCPKCGSLKGEHDTLRKY
jgi:rubrerythrin